MCDAADDEDDADDQDNDECVCLFCDDDVVDDECVFMCNYELFFIVCVPGDPGAGFSQSGHTLREYSVRCAMRLSFQILVFART